MKPLTIADRINIIRLDQMSLDVLAMMQSNPEANEYQIPLHELLGNFKASIVACGCIRPISCGTCRTRVEDEVYWSEKIDDLLDEARQEAQDEREQNNTDI